MPFPSRSHYRFFTRLACSGLLAVLAVMPAAAEESSPSDAAQPGSEEQVIDLVAAEAAQKAAAEQRAARKAFLAEHDERQTADYLKAVPPRGVDPEIEDDMIKMRGLRNWSLLTYPTGTLPPAPYDRARDHVRKNVRSASPWAGRGVELRGGTYEWHQEAMDKALVTPDENVWTALGPAPLDSVGTTNNAYTYGIVAGRVGAEALAVDPSNTSVAYAGFVAGGVWKTTNLGSGSTTWTPLLDDDLNVTQGVSAITIDPTNSSVVYVGTGDWAAGDQFSSGIMKTTDAGATWTQLGADVFAPYSPVLPAGGNRWSNQNIKTIDVDPKNPNTILVGTRYDLYLSNDGGSSWQICGFGNDYTDPAAGSTLRSINRISGIYLDDRGASTVAYVAVGYLVTGNNGNNGVYRFTIPASGCPSWPGDFETLFSGFPSGTGTSTTSATGRIELAGTVGGDGNLTLYAQVQDAASGNYDKEGTWVLRPDGGSTTWTKLGETYSGCSSERTNQDWYDLFIGVDPNDDKTLYIGHIDVFKATVNSSYTSMSVTNMTDVYGTSCANYGKVHPDQHAITFVGNTSTFLVGNDGGVYLNDTGTPAGFQQLNNSFNTFQFYAGQLGADFAGNGMNGVQWAFGGLQDNGNASWDSSAADDTWTGRSVGGDGFFTSFDPLTGTETAGTWMTEYTYGSLYVSTSGADGPFGGGGGGPFGGGCEPRYVGSADWSTPFMLDTLHCSDSSCSNYILGEDYVWAATSISRGCPSWSQISGSQVKTSSGSIITMAMAPSEPKAVATGTSDGKVWWSEQAFSGTGCTQAAANTSSFSCSANNGSWVDADAANSVLPNRAVLQVAFDPVDHNVFYAAVGGFNTNTPSTPGHLFQLTQSGGSITVVDKTGNLPDVPASAVAVNPHLPNQVYVGTHFGFFYTDDITAASPNWIRYQNGLPNTVIQYLTIDRGPASDPIKGTTLGAFTYGRGVYVLKLPTTPTGGNMLPTADFSFSCTDLSCNFTDLSTDSDGTIVAWTWDFGDSTGSTVQNPSHTYAAGGTYTVTLTAQDDQGGLDSFSTQVAVSDPNVDNPPTANFSFSCTDLACNFTDSSSDDNGIVSWTWDFGDASGSTAQNPSHTYAAGGTYTVTLTVGDTANQTDSIQKQVTVSEPPSGDTTPPVVSNVQTTNDNGNKFSITFTTDEPATSQITFTGGGSGTFDAETALTTSHSVQFNGAKGVLYTFNIEATDASSNTSVTGPFQHQND